MFDTSGAQTPAGIQDAIDVCVEHPITEQRQPCKLIDGDQHRIATVEQIRQLVGQADGAQVVFLRGFPRKLKSARVRFQNMLLALAERCRDDERILCFNDLCFLAS